MDELKEQTNDIKNAAYENEVNEILNQAMNSTSLENSKKDKINLDEKNQNKEIQNYIKTANTDILRNTLAPQIQQNEEKKREHKDKLIKYISYFLGGQFIIVVILILLILISMIVFHALKNDYSENILQMIFAFFGTYITSVIAELLSMLHFVIKEVFNTSISDLMKIFKYKEIDEK